MARKRKAGVNVSQAIREYLKANKDVGPTEAAKAISEQVGKTVPATYVSNIKSTLNGAPKKKGKRGRKPGRRMTSAAPVARAKNNGHVDLVTIAAMKELVGKVGADTARQLIDLLA
jgi:hypothetical protein